MLLFEDKIPTQYRTAFVEKVKRGAEKLKTNPDWHMAVMNSETGGTFRSNIENGMGYVGLIQFGPSARQQLGVSYDQLKSMSPVEQLDYVFAYYAPFKNKMTRFFDVYLATFYPYAIGKPESYVIGSEKGPDYVRKVAEMNKGMDYDKDGKITISEFKRFAFAKLPPEKKEDFDKNGMGIAVEAQKYVARHPFPFFIIGSAIIMISYTVIKYRK